MVAINKLKKKKVAAATNAKSQLEGKYVTVGPPKAVPNVTPLEQFRCAIDDPFCSTAQGARVPDQFSANTEPMTLRGRLSVSSTNGATSLVCLPFPTASVLALNTADSTAVTLAASTAGMLAGTKNINTNAGGTATIGFAQMLSAPAFDQAVVSYRVVGWGVRVRVLQAASTVAGNTAVAVFPLTQYGPAQLVEMFDTKPAGAATISGARPKYTKWIELTSFLGAPFADYAPAGATGASGLPIISVEGTSQSEVYANAELASTGGVVVKPKFHSDHFLNFRPPGSAFDIGPHMVPCAGVNGGVFAQYAPFDMECMNGQGHNAVVVQIGGGQLYELELVYHLEVVRRIPVTSQGTMVGTASSLSPFVPRPLFEKTLESLKKSPWVEFVKHEGQKAMGALVQALPGLTTRMAALALTM